MILSDTSLTDLWYAALREEFGLRLLLANPRDLVAVQNALYRVRQELDDPALEALAVCLPKGGKEVWLVQKGTNMNEGPITKRELD